MQSHAVGCENNPVYEFSRTLYLQQYPDAQALLPEIALLRGEVIAQFLGHVLAFSRAYDDQDIQSQKSALDRIDGLIQTTRDLAGDDEPDAQLTQANIMIHAARLHLVTGNILKAVSHARQGKQGLDALRVNNREDVDALLAYGLYDYYTGSKGDISSRLMSLMSLHGNKERGRAMIEQAIRMSPDHAFEALRSLLSDVGWNRNSTCRYLPLIDQQDAPGTISFTYRQHVIALGIFCGQPEISLTQLALLEGVVAEQGLSLTPLQDAWIFEARIHAMASEGAVEGLREIVRQQPKQKEIRYWQANFALARALDTRRLHAQAAAIYQGVITSSLDKRYKSLAKHHLDYPYRPPRHFIARPGKGLHLACDAD